MNLRFWKRKKQNGTKVVARDFATQGRSKTTDEIVRERMKRRKAANRNSSEKSRLKFWSRGKKIDNRSLKQSHEELLKQRQRQKLRERLHPILKGLSLVKRLLDIRFFSFLLILILVIVGINYLHEQQVFILSEIEITGNEEISELQVISTLGELKGTSLFSIHASSLERKLMDSFPYIRQVYIRKELPGKLIVEVHERFPRLAYVNLSGAYLVDGDIVVVDVLGVQEGEPLTEIELLIFNGGGDIEADYVRDFYLSEIDDAKERRQVKWEEVGKTEKEATLIRLRKSIKTRVDQTQEARIRLVNQAGIRSIILSTGVDARVYQVGDEFAEEKYRLSVKVSEYLTGEKFRIKSYKWTSEFTLTVELVNGKEILFSKNKSIETQLAEFQTLNIEGKLRKANTVDLRSDIVVLR